ncbi:MAG: T9SS type A sorting domain-containing protein, partial [Candidatus Atribacteria bacterium]
TKISWQLPSGQKVTLKILNLLGKEVTSLIDEYKPAGVYETEFNASNLPSGVYFYRLQAGPFVQTRKMILLK